MSRMMSTRRPLGSVSVTLGGKIPGAAGVVNRRRGAQSFRGQAAHFSAGSPA